MPTDIVPYLPLIGLVLAGLIAGFFGIRNRRSTEKVPLPPSWPEMWARMDLLERKMNALTGIVATAADQWPANAAGPVFDPQDLAVLEDTLPVKWRPRPSEPHP